LDEHDTVKPHKPFPEGAHFDYLHKLFVEEDKLFIEKSRTVMATWWVVVESFHYVMTHQPSSCIYWCPDQARAEKCIEYAKVLYAQQDPELKKGYPLPRKKSRVEDQAVYRFELAGGSWLEALPGKNPDRIRSEHPTIVVMDEAAFNENGAEAYGNALSTRPVKLVAITSAAPGWFYDLVDPAEPIELLGAKIKGLTLRQIPEGKPGAGIKVARLHYSADSSMTPERVAKLKSEYSNPWIAEREMEINPYAMGGKRIFPGYSDEIHLVDQFELGGSGADWTTYLACDPHPELAHAFVWLCVNRLGEMVIPWSWWPEEENQERARNGKSPILIAEYAKRLRAAEKFAAEANLFPPSEYEIIDVAAKSFHQDEEHSMLEGYRNEGIYFRPGKKNRHYAGYDLINKALTPAPVNLGTEVVMRPKLTIMRGAGDNHLLAKQFRQVHWKENRGIAALEKDPPGQPMDKERHLIDCVSYILLEEPQFWDKTAKLSTFEPIYKNIGY